MMLGGGKTMTDRQRYPTQETARCLLSEAVRQLEEENLELRERLRSAVLALAEAHRETREAERIARALARVLVELTDEDIARAFLAGLEER